MSSYTLTTLQQAVGKELFRTEWVPIPFSQELSFQSACLLTEEFLGFKPVSKDPYGEKLASGFLLLSLLVAFHKRYLNLDTGGESYGLNYGTNHVRFLQPVLADRDSVCCRCELLQLTPRGSDAYCMETRNTLETQEGKIAMVADWITYFKVEDHHGELS